MLLNLPEIEIQELKEALFEEKKVRVFLQREDLIHPMISGNKWRKLRYNLEKAEQLGKKSILTFGGVHSNHLIATAEACRLAKMQAIGIVRGEDLNTETLQNCRERGMELEFVSREEYALKDTKEYLNLLHEKYDYPFIIPQGGDNYYGTLGCAEILKASDLNPDLIFVAAGTGNTAAGILISAKDHQKVYSVPALKGNFMKTEILQTLNNFFQNKEVADEYMEQLEVLDDYHFGGFAKYTDELIEFMQNFYSNHQIKIDPIYTGKMLFALYDQVKKDLLPKNSTVLAIHTGGLQGIPGFERRYEIEIY